MQISAKSILLLESLTSEEAGKISQHAALIEKSQNDPILIENEDVLGIYTIIEGSVDVYVKNIHHMTNLPVGESFGEMAYLEASKSSATLRAAETPTKLVLFTVESLDKISTEEPLISAKMHKGIAKSLSKKLRESNQKISKALDQISEKVDVADFKTILNTNYERLVSSSQDLRESYKEIIDLSKEENVPIEILKAKVLTAGDELDSLLDKISVIGRGVHQLDETAKSLNSIREFFFGSK